VERFSTDGLKLMKKYLEESIALKNSLLSDDNFFSSLSLAITAINKCFERGNKILIAGNGGSAADAQHFAAEIVGRYKLERKGYPAIALTTDSSVMTAWSNDYGYESLFARQIEALGRSGDVFIGISTSGNSPNLIYAMKKSREAEIKTIALSGNNGGELESISDIHINIPSDNTSRIQECHIMAIHIICEEVEKFFV
jgi:D-sedoheptulose 7-phosphate isomerase